MIPEKKYINKKKEVLQEYIALELETMNLSDQDFSRIPEPRKYALRAKHFKKN